MTLMRRRLTILSVIYVVPGFLFAQPSEPPSPLTVEGIREWQKTGVLEPWKQWPKEIKLDVCGDRRPELFLATGGFSRGMSYALFTLKGSSWRLIAEEVDCTAGMVDVLSDEHHGYHDFVAFQRSGRGGFFVRVFSWNGQKYTPKADWELSYNSLYDRE